MKTEQLISNHGAELPATASALACPGSCADGRRCEQPCGVLGALEPSSTLDDDWSKDDIKALKGFITQEGVVRRDFILVPQALNMATTTLIHQCHGASRSAGWWTNPKTSEPINAFDPLVFAQKLCLIHSEVSEAMEGDRKDLMDDKLPHRKMAEVELADALIRICDLAGARGYDLGMAVAEKMAFNAKREDHKLENRQQAGGKSY